MSLVPTENEGGAQSRRDSQSSWGNRLCTDGTIKEQYPADVTEACSGSQSNSLQTKGLKGQEGGHVDWVPECPAVAWPDILAASDDGDDDDEDGGGDDTGQVGLGARQKGSRSSVCLPGAAIMPGFQPLVCSCPPKCTGKKNPVPRLCQPRS